MKKKKTDRKPEKSPLFETFHILVAIAPRIENSTTVDRKKKCSVRKKKYVPESAAIMYLTCRRFDGDKAHLALKERRGIEGS